jgi:DNA mismatch repair protein MutS
MAFHSVLFQEPEDAAPPRTPPACFHDLHLDQVVQAVAARQRAPDLAPLYWRHLMDVDAIAYRQEVARDLQRDEVMRVVTAFVEAMQAMRERLELADKLRFYQHETTRWFLHAVEIYADAVEALARDLRLVAPASRGLRALLAYLGDHTVSAPFVGLAASARRIASALAAVRYCMVIRPGSVTVRAAEGERDYSADVEATFAKFRRGAVKDYRVKLSHRVGIDHVEAAVLERVAQLHLDVFQALESFRTEHASYLDPTIARFDREVQFYLAYLGYIAKLQRAGLPFCFPELVEGRTVHAHDTFDLPLASRLVDRSAAVVRNDFHLQDAERVLVVSGPNQGGKTTFARMVGQLHYLGSLGLPVPGRDARLALFDDIFTHFEREEDPKNQRSKLHDDLIRIHEILTAATPRSIVITNEMFSSTTLADAVVLSRRVMAKISSLDMLAVWVTFLDELASFDVKTVSLVSTVDPQDPAIRTFRLVRAPPSGVAYALTIAEKHGVTYERLKQRIPT